MENEVLEIAFSNVLEELKEIKQEQQKTVTTLLILNEKVDSFEQKLLNLKVIAPTTNMTPVTTTITQELDKIKNTIAAQPKNITRQFRILLFPEYGAREYYGLVFGRLLMWMFFIFIATYLFMLGREYNMLMEGKAGRE